MTTRVLCGGTAVAPTAAPRNLHGRPQQIACCAPTNAAGWMLRFRASGRAFYVYVYAHNPAARRDALTVLDSISIRPAHA